MVYALEFSFSLTVELKSRAKQSREDALARFNDHCAEMPEGEFLGVTEGVLLAEEAHERGYETESWVLDAGEAPHERDWLAQEKILKLTAYFKTEKSAQSARSWLLREYILIPEPRVIVQEEQDWNATWKASFTGIEVDAGFRVLPPWHDEVQTKNFDPKGVVVINPGAGFGTGTHETTQLCLRILRSLGDLTGKAVLDFGSGSGILGITAALQGAKVFCVEIDALANDNAIENARLNGVSDRISFLTQIPDEIRKSRGGKPVDVLIANILRPILIQFSKEIMDCLKPESELVLSGLIESDLAQVIATYQSGVPFEITRFEKNEWRALWLRRKN